MKTDVQAVVDALAVIADSDDVTVMHAVDQDRESALQTWSILHGYIGHKQPSIQNPGRPTWQELKDEDCMGRRIWAMVDDGTDLYVIEGQPGSHRSFYVVHRDDARQPNGKHDGPDNVVCGPFPTLDGARACGLRPRRRHLRPMRTDMLKLYFVAYYSEGENLDLFVWAATPRQAVKLWREHYGALDVEGPDHVFEVPPTAPPKPTVLRWHKDINPVDFETETLADVILEARANNPELSEG